MHNVKSAKLSNPPCLVLFCKRPGLFHGKQRLAKTIGAPQSLIFARAFLECALEDAKAWPGPVVLSPSSEKDAVWAAGLLAREHRVLPQAGGNLGQRINAIDRQLREAGNDRIIFIGSDAPALQARHYAAAFRAINRAAVTLSRATDGGVVLMGSAAPWPDLSALPWSSKELERALSALCRRHEYDVEYIAPGYDVDVEADLARLRRDLIRDPRPARRRLFRHLDEFLSQEVRKYA